MVIELIIFFYKLYFILLTFYQFVKTMYSYENKLEHVPLQS